MTTWTTWKPPGVPFPFASEIHNGELFHTTEAGHDPETGEVPESAAEQTSLAWRKVEARLAAAGLSLDNVVMVRPYVTAREYAQEFDEVCHQVLGDPMPGCGPLLVVELIDPRMKIEMEVIAQRGAVRQ